MIYLIAYDIAEPRRLRRVARWLEKKACRCQKSVFLFRGQHEDVVQLLDELQPLIDANADVVQAWSINDESDDGLVRGTPLPVSSASIVLSGRKALFIKEKSHDSTHLESGDIWAGPELDASPDELAL